MSFRSIFFWHFGIMNSSFYFFTYQFGLLELIFIWLRFNRIRCIYFNYPTNFCLIIADNELIELFLFMIFLFALAQIVVAHGLVGRCFADLGEDMGLRVVQFELGLLQCLLLGLLLHLDLEGVGLGQPQSAPDFAAHHRLVDAFTRVIRVIHRVSQILGVQVTFRLRIRQRGLRKRPLFYCLLVDLVL